MSGRSASPSTSRCSSACKSHTLELGETIGRACNRLVEKIYPALTTLIARASSDLPSRRCCRTSWSPAAAGRIRGFDTPCCRKS